MKKYFKQYLKLATVKQQFLIKRINKTLGEKDNMVYKVFMMKLLSLI